MNTISISDLDQVCGGKRNGFVDPCSLLENPPLLSATTEQMTQAAACDRINVPTGAAVRARKKFFQGKNF